MARSIDAQTAADIWQAKQARLPVWMVWMVLALCVFPVGLNLVGIELDTIYRSSDVAFEANGAREPIPKRVPIGPFVHTILEWSAFCVALFTVVFAFTHYRVKRDITTPIIGTALFCSGTIDAFRIFAADGLIESVENPQRFILFTWAISRLFNVCILIAGTAPFVWKAGRRFAGTRQMGARYIVIVGTLLATMSFAIVHICATVRELPTTVYPNAIIHRPWDAIPLVLYLIAGGIVLPRFHRKHPSLFSHGLLVSVIPHLGSQTYATFGSMQLFDNGFNVSLYLKIIAYAVPLTGLILDYTRVYGVEVAMSATREKLRVARDVQKGLLPQHAPEIDGFDIAGASQACDAVGGDYFDYVTMKNGRCGIVIADVSGHEIGASILMAKTRAYLRALAHTTDDFGAMVTQLNRYLVEDVKNRWFVTMFLASLKPQDRTFEYLAAGHECYLLTADGETQHLEATSPPLGVLDDGKLAHSGETGLQSGDILLLLTDGILEAQSPEGEQFGLERAVEAVSERRTQPASEIVECLQDAVQTFCQHRPPTDDMTVVVLKCNGQS